MSGPATAGSSGPAPKSASFNTAQQDTAKNFDKSKTPDCTKQGCTADQWKLVELVEVIKKGGVDVRQPVKGRKQYINLDPNADPAQYHAEYGRRIRLQARVQWTGGDATRSLAGKQVYWYHKPAGGNRKGLKGSMLPGINASAVEKIPSTTAADGWTPVTEMVLSKYGGDKFDVFATEDAGYKGGLKAGTYEVWRKLYYELDCMSRAKSGTYADRADVAGMTSKLKAGWVEVERTGTDASPPFSALMKNSAVEAWATKYRDGKGTPRYYHLVLLDTIAVGPNPTALTFDLSAPYVLDLDREKYLLDPADWLISGSYSILGTATTGPLTTTTLKLTQTGTTAAKNEKTVLTLDTSAMTLAKNAKVRVTLNLKLWTELSGLQVPTGPATIIGMRWREVAFAGSDLTGSTLNTMLHEPGHAMGLASTTLPDQTAVTTTIYKNGHHCTNLSNRCVMFTANSTSTTLCPTCLDALRGRDLASLPISGGAPFN